MLLLHFWFWLCPRRPERSGRFITQQQIWNIFYPSGEKKITFFFFNPWIYLWVSKLSNCSTVWQQRATEGRFVLLLTQNTVINIYKGCFVTRRNHWNTSLQTHTHFLSLSHNRKSSSLHPLTDRKDVSIKQFHSRKLPARCHTLMHTRTHSVNGLKVIWKVDQTKEEILQIKQRERQREDKCLVCERVREAWHWLKKRKRKWGRDTLKGNISPLIYRCLSCSLRRASSTVSLSLSFFPPLPLLH